MLLTVLPPYERRRRRACSRACCSRGFVEPARRGGGRAVRWAGALRRRRPDLPRMIAADYAGAWLLARDRRRARWSAACCTARAARAEEAPRARRWRAAMHDYVRLARRRSTARGLGTIDAVRIEPDHYRACVPGRAIRAHWLCLFVSDRPAARPGITRDTDAGRRTATGYRPATAGSTDRVGADVAPLDGSRRRRMTAGLSPVERDLERDRRALPSSGVPRSLRAARAALPQPR